METLELPKALKDAESFEEHKRIRQEARAQAERKTQEPKPEPELKLEEKPKPSDDAEEPDSQEETAGKSAIPGKIVPEKKEEPKPAAPKSKARNAIERARELIKEGREDEAERILAGAAEKRENDRFERLERELQEFRTRKPVQETKAPEPHVQQRQQVNPGDRAPLPTDPEFQKENGFLDFMAAKTMYEIDQRNKAQREAERVANENRTRQENLSRLAWKAQEARTKFSDFDQVTYGDDATQSGFILTAPMQEYVMHADEPMDVLYHLAKNRGEYERIKALPPARQAAELGRFEERILARQQASTLPTQEKPKPAPVSRVPAPPRHISGTEASANTDWRNPDLSFDEYKKLRRR